MLSITSKRTYPVILAYICSHCGEAVMNTTLIHANATKHYWFCDEKAANIVSQTTEDAIAFQINRIKNCKKHHTVLCSERSRNAADTDRTILSGFDTPCPHCGKQEPWQNIEIPNSPQRTPPESWPTVFTSKSSAKYWLQQHNAADSISILLPESISELIAAETIFGTECFTYPYDPGNWSATIAAYFHAKWKYDRWARSLWLFISAALLCAIEVGRFFADGGIRHLIIAIVTLLLCLRTNFFLLSAHTTEKTKRSCYLFTSILAAIAIFAIGFMVGVVY